MAECNHDCSSCKSKCGEATSLLAPQNAGSQVKRVIGVVSGKGGVGKSLVTGLLATLLKRRGYSTAVLDADITGPSIPKMFGIKDKAMGCDEGIFPVESKTGVRVMSINLLLEHDTDPVVWRGSLISGTVKQFWSDVIWGDVDYMFVDLPPGTGDVPLTVFQSLPINGVILVTSPQSLVSMIVSKAVNMAKMMDVPVYGFVENYSYFRCPDCGKTVEIFGKSKLSEIALEYSLPVLARLPIDPDTARLCDEGKMEQVSLDGVMPAAELIAKAK